MRRYPYVSGYDRPTGELPLKKKDNALNTVPQGWCGNQYNLHSPKYNRVYFQVLVATFKYLIFAMKIDMHYSVYNMNEIRGWPHQIKR